MKSSEEHQNSDRVRREARREPGRLAGYWPRLRLAPEGGVSILRYSISDSSLRDCLISSLSRRR